MKLFLVNGVITFFTVSDVHHDQFSLFIKTSVSLSASPHVSLIITSPGGRFLLKASLSEDLSGLQNKLFDAVNTDLGLKLTGVQLRSSH